MSTLQDPRQKESQTHGDVFLPVSSYHSLLYRSYTELAPHWHDEMEVTLITEGRCRYRVYSDSFPVEPGDMILVAPRYIHSARQIPGETMVSDSLVFHLDLLGAAGQDFSASRYLRPLASGELNVTPVIHGGDPGCREILRTFRDALQCFRSREPFYELKIRERLLHLLLLLWQYGYIRQTAGPEDTHPDRAQIHQVLHYINAHYRERLTIPALAALVGFSESHFMFFFKKHTGMTCTRYINHYRVAQAAQALETTDLPIIDIAMEHGFDNISYFNRQFRAQFAMTPTQFRQKQRAAGIPAAPAAEA